MLLQVNSSFGRIYNTGTRGTGYLFGILMPCKRDGANGVSPHQSVRSEPLAASCFQMQRSQLPFLGAFKIAKTDY